MRARMATAALAAVLVLGACGDGGEDSGGDDGGGGASSEHAHDAATADDDGGEPDAPPFAEADATTKVDVTLQDYAFVGLPETVAGPNVLFAASIRGGNTHELEVTDAAGKVVGEVRPFRAPGARSAAVVLEPGAYTVQCLIKEGTRTHAQLGMKKSLTVS